MSELPFAKEMKGIPINPRSLVLVMNFVYIFDTYTLIKLGRISIPHLPSLGDCCVGLSISM